MLFNILISFGIAMFICIVAIAIMLLLWQMLYLITNYLYKKKKEIVEEKYDTIYNVVVFVFFSIVFLSFLTYVIYMNVFAK